MLGTFILLFSCTADVAKSMCLAMISCCPVELGMWYTHFDLPIFTDVSRNVVTVESSGLHICLDPVILVYF